MNEQVQEQCEPGNWPLWRTALHRLRKLPTFGYGMTMETSWFEHALGCARDTAAFAFQMLSLRDELESEDGYYLGSHTIQHEETGMKMEVWQIPDAKSHEDVASGFEGRMRRYAHRSVDIRVKTLNNPKADLDQETRDRMEGASRIAATRLVLLRREKGVAKLVRKHAPKMLENGAE